MPLPALACAYLCRNAREQGYGMEPSLPGSRRLGPHGEGMPPHRDRTRQNATECVRHRRQQRQPVRIKSLWLNSTSRLIRTVSVRSASPTVHQARPRT